MRSATWIGIHPPAISMCLPSFSNIAKEMLRVDEASLWDLPMCLHALPTDKVIEDGLKKHNAKTATIRYPSTPMDQ